MPVRTWPAGAMEMGKGDLEVGGGIGVVNFGAVGEGVEGLGEGGDGAAHLGAPRGFCSTLAAPAEPTRAGACVKRAAMVDSRGGEQGRGASRDARHLRCRSRLPR